MIIIGFLAALAAPAASARPLVPTPPKAAVDPAAVNEAILLIDQEDFEGETIRNADLALEFGIAGMVAQIQKKSGGPIRKIS